MLTERRWDCEAHHVSSRLLRHGCPQAVPPCSRAERLSRTTAAAAAADMQHSHATLTNRRSAKQMWAVYLLEGVCVLQQFSSRSPVGALALRELLELSASVASSHASHSRPETSGGSPAGACNMRQTVPASMDVVCTTPAVITGFDTTRLHVRTKQLWQQVTSYSHWVLLMLCTKAGLCGVGAGALGLSLGLPYGHDNSKWDAGICRAVSPSHLPTNTHTSLTRAHSYALSP